MLKSAVPFLEASVHGTVLTDWVAADGGGLKLVFLWLSGSVLAGGESPRGSERGERGGGFNR